MLQTNTSVLINANNSVNKTLETIKITAFKSCRSYNGKYCQSESVITLYPTVEMN